MKILRRSFAALVFALALAYALDALLFQFRAVKYSTVHVTPYYAVPRKDKKTEYTVGDPRDETCANALFPQGGNTPCWYLRRHREERIDL